MHWIDRDTGGSGCLTFGGDTNLPLNAVIERYQFVFVPYPIPHKVKNKGNIITKKNCYALSWPFTACRIEQKISISQVLLNYSHSVNEEYKPKYDNANEFLEWYKKNIFPKIPKQ